MCNHSFVGKWFHLEKVNLTSDDGWILGYIDLVLEVVWVLFNSSIVVKLLISRSI